MDNYITRVEIRLTGKKRPLEYLTKIDNLVQRIVVDYYNPFDRIFINQIKFKKLSEMTSLRDAYKLGELKSISYLESFQIARRRLNKNKNFNRDYKHLFKKTNNFIELGPVFKSTVIKQFKIEGEDYE